MLERETEVTVDNRASHRPIRRLGDEEHVAAVNSNLEKRERRDFGKQYILGMLTLKWQ